LTERKIILDKDRVFQERFLDGRIFCFFLKVAASKDADVRFVSAVVEVR
jgi:hypothetical protein